MSYFPEIDNCSQEELRSLFDSDSYTRKDEEEHAWYTEVAAKIVADEEGVDFLLSRFPYADLSRLRAILLALSLPKKKRPKIRKVLLSSLMSSQPLVVAEAIGSASHLGYKDFFNNIIYLTNHESPYVKVRILEFLSHYYPTIAEAYIIEALGSSDHIVRSAAIDQIDDYRIKSLIPKVRDLLNDENEFVRQAAETTVKNSSTF